jgi:hypothetical protein
MLTLIAGIVAFALLYMLLNAFRSADPHKMARAVKIAGGILSLAGAAFVGLRGQVAVAVPLAVFGLGLLGWSPFPGASFSSRTRKSPGQASRVRTAFVEMTLDHDSGELSGAFIAGAHAGRDLGEFDLAALKAAFAGLDDDSRALLANYMDRRFSGWRENAEGDAAYGGRGTASSGKMSDEEAYQILGLQPGASRDDIGRAHRALMKKLHPDQGGSTYLAARVNEAKDTLLRRHRR